MIPGTTSHSTWWRKMSCLPLPTSATYVGHHSLANYTVADPTTMARQNIMYALSRHVAPQERCGKRENGQRNKKHRNHRIFTYTLGHMMGFCFYCTNASLTKAFETVGVCSWEPVLFCNQLQDTVCSIPVASSQCISLSL